MERKDCSVMILFSRRSYGRDSEMSKKRIAALVIIRKLSQIMSVATVLEKLELTPYLLLKQYIIISHRKLVCLVSTTNRTVDWATRH